jgi:hypothetical protein
MMSVAMCDCTSACVQDTWTRTAYCKLLYSHDVSFGKQPPTCTASYRGVNPRALLALTGAPAPREVRLSGVTTDTVFNCHAVQLALGPGCRLSQAVACR